MRSLLWALNAIDAMSSDLAVGIAVVVLALVVVADRLTWGRW